jgi:uncharacterized protein YbbK (DUF523 family)
MPDRPKLLASACLLGRPVRHNGSAKTLSDHLIERWCRENRVFAACPELMAGLPTPRPAAEIAAGSEGNDVLHARAKVVESNGRDVTLDYVAGAQEALRMALHHGCRLALLTDGSPSCGSSYVYDGTFSGHRHPGAGVTAALLRAHCIRVFAPSDLDELSVLMDRPGAPAPASGSRRENYR